MVLSKSGDAIRWSKPPPSLPRSAGLTLGAKRVLKYMASPRYPRGGRVYREIAYKIGMSPGKVELALRELYSWDYVAPRKRHRPKITAEGINWVNAYRRKVWGLPPWG